MLLKATQITLGTAVFNVCYWGWGYQWLAQFAAHARRTESDCPALLWKAECASMRLQLQWCWGGCGQIPGTCWSPSLGNSETPGSVKGPALKIRQRVIKTPDITLRPPHGEGMPMHNCTTHMNKCVEFMWYVWEWEKNGYCSEKSWPIFSNPYQFNIWQERLQFTYF